MNQPVQFSFAAFERSPQAFRDHFPNRMESVDQFRITESRFELTHDELGGSPRFVVNQVDLSHVAPGDSGNVSGGKSVRADKCTAPNKP